MSVSAFVAIGLLEQFHVKGYNESLLRLLADEIVPLLSGRESLQSALFWARSLGTLMLVAAVIGWFLQSVVVIILDWRREKRKPLA